VETIITLVILPTRNLILHLVEEFKQIEELNQFKDLVDPQLHLKAIKNFR